MGLFKKLFKSGPAPAEKLSDEDRKRMGLPERWEEKPVSQMTEDERLRYWGQACELADLDERLRRLEELAEAGFSAAWVSVIDTCFAISEERGTELPFEKMERCARNAADAGLAEGHTYLGMLLGSPMYGEPDAENAALEYLLAIEGGSDAAVRLLLDYWNKEFHVEKYTPEENREITNTFHACIREALKPEIERLCREDTREALTALGLLYFHGIYFEQSLDKAKEYFTKLSGMGSALGRRMLANPVFEEDEDDEDE